jgi:cytochrome o ubiquinol oxidase subunit 1
MLVALSGALLILLGIALTAVQIAVSIRQRERNRDLTGDPWNGRTLEWSTASPPPAWNFSQIPQIDRADAFWAMKQQRATAAGRALEPRYESIEVPRNTPVGFFLAFFTVILGFSLIWHIWWGAGFGLLGTIVVCLMQAWRVDGEVEIPAERVAAFEQLHGIKARTA